MTWIRHIKQVLHICLQMIDNLKPESHADSMSLALYLHTLVNLTSPNTWGILRSKGLDNMQTAFQKICHNFQGDLIQKGFFDVMTNILVKGSHREDLSLKPVTLCAIMTLCTRPLIDGNFSKNLLGNFLSSVMSVPALIYLLNLHAPKCIQNLQSMNILERILNFSDDYLWFEEFALSVPGTKTLALLANLVHLFNIEPVCAYPQMTVSTLNSRKETIETKILSF